MCEVREVETRRRLDESIKREEKDWLLQAALWNFVELELVPNIKRRKFEIWGKHLHKKTYMWWLCDEYYEQIIYNIGLYTEI